jgi:hypothetical protein
MHNKRRISRLPDVSCIFIVTVNTAHTVIKVNTRIMISRILNMPFLIDANDLRTIINRTYIISENMALPDMNISKAFSVPDM